jgi:hypothetical protein
MGLQAPGEVFILVFEKHYQIFNISVSSVNGQSVGSSKFGPHCNEKPIYVFLFLAARRLIVGIYI